MTNKDFESLKLFGEYDQKRSPHYGVINHMTQLGAE